MLFTPQKEGTIVAGIRSVFLAALIDVTDRRARLEMRILIVNASELRKFWLSMKNVSQEQEDVFYLAFLTLLGQ